MILVSYFWDIKRSLLEKILNFTKCQKSQSNWNILPFMWGWWCVRRKKTNQKLHPSVHGVSIDLYLSVSLVYFYDRESHLFYVGIPISLLFFLSFFWYLLINSAFLLKFIKNFKLSLPEHFGACSSDLYGSMDKYQTFCYRILGWPITLTFDPYRSNEQALEWSENCRFKLKSYLYIFKSDSLF